MVEVACRRAVALGRPVAVVGFLEAGVAAVIDVTPGGELLRSEAVTFPTAPPPAA